MGAVGDLAVPDPVSLWGFVLKIRRELDLWANIRPARLLERRVSSRENASRESSATPSCSRNLFGDILTDPAAALHGGLGMAASANVAPGRTCLAFSSLSTARRPTSTDWG